MAVRLSALRAGRTPFSPGKFLVLISVRGWVDPKAIVRLKGLGNWKIQWLHRETNRDLPACRIMPQPTTLPHAREDLTSYNFSAEKIAVVCKGVEEAEGRNSISVIGSLSVFRFFEQGYWTEKESRAASWESVMGVCVCVYRCLYYVNVFQSILLRVMGFYLSHYQINLLCVTSKRCS
jgi:hypothetical protein